MKKNILTAALVFSIAAMTTGPSPRADEITRHTVERGDTLWDLSESYLTKPWRWPNIWQINPEIEDPHWIYPGQVIRIPLAPPPADPPSLVEEAVKFDPYRDYPADPPAIIGSGQPLPLMVTRSATPEIDRKLRLTEAEQRQAEIEAILARQYDRGIGMVTWNLPDAGRVVESQRGWQHAGGQEKVLIEAPGAQPGQRFGVYRDLGRVPSPEARGESPGHLLAEIAILEVIGSEVGKMLAMVQRSFAELRGGDLLGPVPTPPEITDPLPDKDSITVPTSVIAIKQHRAIAAPGTIVYLDRGGNEGLAPGLLLSVRSPDGGETGRRNAELMVLRVTPERAAAMLTANSRNHVRTGDRVGPIR